MIHFRPTHQPITTPAVEHVHTPVAPAEVQEAADQLEAPAKREKKSPFSAFTQSIAKLFGARTPAHVSSLRGATIGFEEPASPAVAAAATSHRNDKLATKYPSLAFLLHDPDAFMSDMRARFEAQKKITPSNPHLFDISDFGFGLVHELKSAVDNKLEALKQRAPSTDQRLAVTHLTELQQELKAQIASGKLTYQQLQELGYFVSRGLGHFDAQALNLRDRAALRIDRGMQGHKKESIAEELQRYRDRKFDVFQAKSSVKAFDNVQDAFDKAFFDKDKLHFFYVPSAIELDRDIFMRLAMHPIFLGGVAEKPIPADGFVRPGYDFWLHDIRHASLIWSEFQRYSQANGLDEAQQAKLRGQYDVWMGELDEAIAKLPEKQREAVIFFKFNYCHERGILPLPSSFTDKAPKFMSGLREPLFMTNLNFRVLKLTDQAPTFTTFLGSADTFREAYLFLQNFFADKHGIEKSIAGKDVFNPSTPSNYDKTQRFSI